MLTHREGGAWLTVHNTIRDNRFVATCASPAVGLGYFVGRATGYAADGSWSPDTTSFFTGNDPQHQGTGHDWARNDGCSFYE